jgi:hypothetical protein
MTAARQWTSFCPEELIHDCRRCNITHAMPCHAGTMLVDYRRLGECQYLFVPVVGSKGQVSGGGANWPEDLCVRRWKISEYGKAKELALDSARGEEDEDEDETAAAVASSRAELINLVTLMQADED